MGEKYKIVKAHLRRNDTKGRKSTKVKSHIRWKPKKSNGSWLG